ncbi:MC/SLC25 family protein [Candidatus Woesearchaeota archaeon]|nr:MC/SLC25 family protein [Candidatus Woesearchaeota archaeon]
MDFLPGIMLGITRVTISYPFEFVKTNMQKNIYSNVFIAFKNSSITKLYRGSSLYYISVPIDRSLQFYICEKLKDIYNPYVIGLISGISTSIYNIPVTYICTNVMTTENSTKAIISKMIKEKAYYNGWKIELSRSITSTPIYIGTYYYLREKYKDQRPEVYGCFSCISNMLTWSITYPIDTIRTEYQTSKKNVYDIILNKYNKYGFMGFYNGISAIFMRTIPSAFVGMFVYEYTRKILGLNI